MMLSKAPRKRWSSTAPRRVGASVAAVVAGGSAPTPAESPGSVGGVAASSSPSRAPLQSVESAGLLQL